MPTPWSVAGKGAFFDAFFVGRRVDDMAVKCGVGYPWGGIVSPRQRFTIDSVATMTATKSSPIYSLSAVSCMLIGG